MSSLDRLDPALRVQLDLSLGLPLRLARVEAEPGGNCIKTGPPGKSILSERKGPILLKIVSENRFTGKTYFIQLVPVRLQHAEVLLERRDQVQLLAQISLK